MSLPKFQPVSESLIKEMNLHYDTIVSAGQTKTHAQKQTAAYFGVGMWTVGKYVVKPRSTRNKAISPGTLVTLSNGSEIPVEQIKPGDFLFPNNKVISFHNLKQLPETEIKRTPVQKTFIITGWELRVAPNYKFVDCLRQIAKTFDAELLLTSCYAPDLSFLPPELRHTFRILEKDEHFNDNLFFKYTETHALASSPLLGWKGAFEKTTIIPGLIKELETEASTKYCKQIMSTGSVGYLDPDLESYGWVSASNDENFRKSYAKRMTGMRSQKKTTAIAKEYVKPSAVIVHVLNDKQFLTRYVTMETDGVVFDLDKKYTAGKSRPEASRPAFLNISDTHEWFADETALKASYEQIAWLKPHEVFLNDFVDGISANHHEKDRAIVYHNAPSIKTEINQAVERMKLIKQKCDTVGASLGYIKSNHCDFFEKILDAGEKYWRMNYNYDTCIEIQHKRTTTGLHPIQILIDFDALGIKYICDRSNYKSVGVNIKHGHEPINGKRSTFKGLVQHYNQVSVNHFHAPKVFRNGACGGLTAIVDMPYMRGLSAAMSANSHSTSTNARRRRDGRMRRNIPAIRSSATSRTNTPRPSSSAKSSKGTP